MTLTKQLFTETVNDFTGEMIKETKTRTKALIGAEALKTLEDTHVVICGLGGVGSYAAEALARSSVGFLTLVDFDRISLSNINRQIPALLSTVGEYKVEAMAQRIKDINPACRIFIKTEFIDKNNVAEIVENADYLVDTIDSVEGKIALILYAKEHDIPLVSCMGTGNKLSPESMEISDISRTSACPLARVVRQELKKHGISKGVRVVYSKEKTKREELLKEKGKLVPSSIIFVPGCAGLFLASVVIRDVLNIPIKNSK